MAGDIMSFAFHFKLEKIQVADRNTTYLHATWDVYLSDITVYLLASRKMQISCCKRNTQDLWSWNDVSKQGYYCSNIVDSVFNAWMMVTFQYDGIMQPHDK